MNNNTYLQTGKVFFAVALIAIGIIHFITGTFPSGLLPVASAYPGKIVFGLFKWYRSYCSRSFDHSQKIYLSRRLPGRGYLADMVISPAFAAIDINL
jgi:hypothetical protein